MWGSLRATPARRRPARRRPAHQHATWRHDRGPSSRSYPMECTGRQRCTTRFHGHCLLCCWQLRVWLGPFLGPSCHLASRLKALPALPPLIAHDDPACLCLSVTAISVRSEGLQQRNYWRLAKDSPDEFTQARVIDEPFACEEAKHVVGDINVWMVASATEVVHILSPSIATQQMRLDLWGCDLVLTRAHIQGTLPHRVASRADHS